MNTPVSQTAIWQQLADHARRVVDQPLTRICGERGRFERMCHSAAGLTLDLSKQRIDHAAFAGLVELASRIDLGAAVQSLFAGAPVNSTERRAALHTALRAEAEDGGDRHAEVLREREHMLSMADDIRTGKWRGFSGKAIEDVVHIGIGGSHLGPALMVDALPPTWKAPRCHFLANVDGAVADTVLRRINPESTLFIIASKSFGTIESHVNAQTARSWFIERTGSITGFSKHAVAITSKPEAAKGIGIDPDRILTMWDWVGGRYSVWSSVGLPIAIHLGSDGFRKFLAGARDLDRHALAAPIDHNLPMLMAVAGIWNYNFLGAQSHAVLPYSHRLRRLPDYLQQLEMESNGKSVRTDGTAVDVQTVPVLWGGEETNGQHAFHQFLHQGTRAFSIDFVAAIDPGHDFDSHHDWLLANCLAQAEALVRGREVAGADPLAPHRSMPGNRGSTTLLLDSLSPYSMGALLALYEHKVYCQGMIWGINPFDQWGVELGKTIGESLHASLAGQAAADSTAVTQRLIEVIKRKRRRRKP